MTLDELFEIIEARKTTPPAGSYTYQLISKGEDAILQKIGEEAVEVLLAAKGQGNQRLIEEVADLFYHALVLLASRGQTLEEVQDELERRHALSQRKQDQV
jgi:phosphoribosyl-ATP pyrophosphohydrolase